MNVTFTELLRRLLRDDSGQDLVEYALLTATVGLAGLAAYAAIRANMKTSYEGWVQTGYDNWHPSDPGP